MPVARASASGWSPARCGRSFPARDLARTHIHVNLQSEIPAGYGLKSSSSISSAVALACAKLFGPEVNDSRVLLAGVDASIETGNQHNRCLWTMPAHAITAALT